MKLAFIGASHWHLPLYLEPALEVPDTQVVGISDPDPGYVARWSGLAVPATSISARSAATPDRTSFALGRHSDMVEQARFLIEEGIPFALEKPCWPECAGGCGACRSGSTARQLSSDMLVFRNGDFAARLRGMSADGIQYMTFRFIAGFAARYQQANCHWMLIRGCPAAAAPSISHRISSISRRC